MKILLALTLMGLTLGAYAAPPKFSTIKKGLSQSLKGSPEVEVRSLKRVYIYYLACTLHPDICFDGIRDYRVHLRIKTAGFGDLDFDCDLDQYTRKHEIVIRMCVPVGHQVPFRSLMKEPSGFVRLKG